MSLKPVAIGLVHAPVLDRRGDRVVSAVTNLDVHDIARAARTYGVQRYYIITPSQQQRALVDDILAHWRRGHGASYNPARAEALALVAVVSTVEEAVEDWERYCEEFCTCFLTSARAQRAIDVPRAKRQMQETPALILFGTGHGMAPELFTQDRPVLTAIMGRGTYNHLSVRSAVAILLDRLLGDEPA